MVRENVGRENVGTGKEAGSRETGPQVPHLLTITDLEMQLVVMMGMRRG